MERRKEPRCPAEGGVEIRLPEPVSRSIKGELVDISNSGMRVRHGDLSLSTGQRVRYSHAGGAGTALVMWTRVHEGTVESGLYTALA